MVVMVLAEGFEESEAVVTADILRRAGIELVIAGLDSLKVKGSHNITIEADILFENMDTEPDGIFLPGGVTGANNLAANTGLIKLVKKLDSEKKMVAAICAAPAIVLGKAGVIDNRRFTCFPGKEKEKTAEKGIFLKDDVVQDDNIITSRGMGTAGLFGLKIVEYLKGAAVAQETGRKTLIL